MSSIAALYDIHGNLPALRAVLAEVESEEIDEIVVGGDVLPGPMPGSCLELLMAVNVPVKFILGNGDRACFQLSRGQTPDDVPAQFQHLLTWSSKQISPAGWEVLDNSVFDDEREVEAIGKVILCHATPESDREIFVPTSSATWLQSIFGKVEADLVVCGHTHMQFDFKVGKVRVVNAGSIGSPYGEPGAYWLKIDRGIQLRKTSYDLDAAAAQIRKSGYPDAEAFAASLLNPPSEKEKMKTFSAFGRLVGSQPENN